MPRPFWSGGFSGWGSPSPEEEQHAYGHPKSLQDGLLQIGSQACHILVHRIDSAAAEAIRGHHSRRTSPRRHRERMQARCDADPEQYVVLLQPQPQPQRPAGLPTVSVSTPAVPAVSGTSGVKPKAITSPLAYDKRALSRASTSTTAKENGDEIDWGSHFLLRSDDEFSSSPNNSTKWQSQRWCKPSYIPITLILVLIFLVVLLPLLDQAEHWNVALHERNLLTCSNSCRISLVESIPEGLTFPPGSPRHPTTYEAWSNLINISESSIHIAALYWSLRGADVYPHPSAYQGEDIFNQLMEAAVDRNIKLKIAQNAPSRDLPSPDTEILEKKGMAEVRSLNFAKLLGAGVLHTKFWIVDNKHLYIGSANMDWRSLTQVKEMGAVIYDCPCIANDLGKIFSVYWDLGQKGAVIPPKWPDSYATLFNMDAPMNITLNETVADTFLSSSPPEFSPSGRTGDSDALVGLILKAEKFIYIAVMDYVPLMIYTHRPKFWPILDNALRTAAIDNKVEVRLLISHWNHTRASELLFLKSLTDISSSYKDVKIEVKLFTVPSSPDQSKIPFARVNHNKYMVTDGAAYIGTSNWSGDYFTNTAGVGLVVQPKGTPRRQESLPVRDQLQAVFERDWNSTYAKPLHEMPRSQKS